MENYQNYLQILYVVIFLFCFREPFPVSKSIHVMKIINLIERGLEVNCQTLTRNSIIDNIALGALLPEFHVKLFDLLAGLILILGTNLLIYTKQIVQMIIQSLRWTNTGRAFGTKRPYHSVRIAAYNALIGWCRMAGYGSTVEKSAEYLIGDILNDITPFQTEVTLKVLPGARKQLTKKARKRLHTAQNDASNMSKVHSNASSSTKTLSSDAGNEELCTTALTSLSQILKVAGPSIKATLHRLLHESIVGLALSVTTATTLHGNLYDSAGCRLALFQTLYNLVECPHHLMPPPFQYAIRVFSMACVRDSSVRVRTACADWMRGLERILHPQKQYLNFEVELGDIEKVLRADKLTIVGSNEVKVHQNGEKESNGKADKKNMSANSMSDDEDLLLQVSDNSSDATVEFIPTAEMMINRNIKTASPRGDVEDNNVEMGYQMLNEPPPGFEDKKILETIDLDSDKDDIQEIIVDVDEAILTKPLRKRRSQSISINLCDEPNTEEEIQVTTTTVEEITTHEDDIDDLDEDEDENLDQFSTEFSSELNKNVVNDQINL